MVTRPLSVSIVVPAYNEARRLSASLTELIRFLSKQHWDWELRVVDDGSTDESAAIVERVSANEPRVVLQRELHRGKGGAVRAGLLAARGDYRIVCDADLAAPVGGSPSCCRRSVAPPSRSALARVLARGASANRFRATRRAGSSTSLCERLCFREFKTHSAASRCLPPTAVAKCFRISNATAGH